MNPSGEKRFLPGAIGATGATGAIGPTGRPGRDITPGAKLGIIGLLILVLLVGGGNLWATYTEVNSFKQQIAAQEIQQKAANAIFGKKLCATLDRLAALKAPPGSATANPSRAYEQELAATLSELKPDVGCP